MDKLRGGFKPHVRFDLWLSFDPRDKANSVFSEELIKSMQNL